MTNPNFAFKISIQYAIALSLCCLVYFMYIFELKNGVANKPATGFTRIPYDLNQISLIKKIVPDKEYPFWQFIHAWESHIEIVRSEGVKPHIVDTPYSGFLREWGGHSFIVYQENDNLQYVTSEKDLIRFLGYINNFEEALLLAKIKGLWFDRNDVRGGSFKKTDSGYEMYLSKYYWCPEKCECINVKVDTMGNFYMKNLGTYFESTSCVMF